jgi:hypothetical protein
MSLQIRTKVLVLSGGGVLAVGLGALLALGRLHQREEQAAAFHALRGAARSFAALERGDIEKLSVAADALASDESLRRAFLARDRAALQAAAAPILGLLRARGGVTHLYFIEPDRTCFLRVHAPELFGDRIDRVTLALAEQSGDVGAGKELGRTAFALRVVRPLRGPGDRLEGYIEVGEEIDHFLVRMKQQTGDDFALVVDKRHLDEAAWAEMSRPARSTWNDRPDVVVVDTTTFTSGIVDFRGDIGQLREEGTYLDEQVQEGRLRVRGVFPVRDAAGGKVGALFVLHDAGDLHAAYASAQGRGALVVLGLVAVVFAALALGLERLVFARLRAIRAGVERMAGGGKEPQPAPGGRPAADDLAQLGVLLEKCGAGPDLAAREGTR